MSVPCSCLGLLSKNCACAENLYDTRRPKSNVDVTNISGTASELNITSKEKKSITKKPRHSLNKFFENLYIKCATYNLKYCPFYTSMGQKNYVANTMRDVGVMFCFLFANLVIFLIIASRMAIDIMFVVIECGRWLYRFMFLPNPEFRARKQPVMIKATESVFAIHRLYTGMK